jgi:hypothetical protein
MNYIKNNSIFLAILFIAIIIFISLLLFSARYSEETERLIITLKQSQKEIDRNRNKIRPFLGLDYEITNAHRDLDRLALIEREQNRLWNMVLSGDSNIAINWTQKDTDSINSILIRQYTQLRKLCRAKNIVLPGSAPSNLGTPFLPNNNPGKAEFGFGFKAYDGNWPNFSPEEAQKLGIQMTIIRQIVEFLSKSATDDHSLKLISILREPVGPIDDNNIGDDKLVLAEFKSKLLKPQRIVDSMCFEITFVGITSHARTFMNQLSPPYLLRDFVADRDTTNISSVSNPDTPSIFSPDPGQNDSSELPIVQDVRSKFSFLIEYVTKVDRDHDKFFKSTMNDESIDIEVLKDFLEKSGHSKIIEPLIQYFKDRDDS